MSPQFSAPSPFQVGHFTNQGASLKAPAAARQAGFVPLNLPTSLQEATDFCPNDLFLSFIEL